MAASFSLTAFIQPLNRTKMYPVMCSVNTEKDGSSVPELDRRTELEGAPSDMHWYRNSSRLHQSTWTEVNDWSLAVLYDY